MGLPLKEATFTLDASASTDSDGTIVSYAWDTDNDGAFDDATGVEPIVWFPTADHSGWACASPTTMARPATTYVDVNVDGRPWRPARPSAPRRTPSRRARRCFFDAGASHTMTARSPAMSGISTATAASRRSGSSRPPGAATQRDRPEHRSPRHRQRRSQRRRHARRFVQAPAAAPPRRIRAGCPATVRRGRGRRIDRRRLGRSTSGGQGGVRRRRSARCAGARRRSLAAAPAGSAIQPLKLVVKKGLGPRCSADRAATCSVTASLQPGDARKLGLSKSRTKAYVSAAPPHASTRRAP